MDRHCQRARTGSDEINYTLYGWILRKFLSYVLDTFAEGASSKEQ
jgi:hypothetical protein